MSADIDFNSSEMRHFEYSMAHNSLEGRGSWDEWQELWRIEGFYPEVQLAAFLDWVVKNKDWVLVDSTYPAKSLLLDIALSLLVGQADGNEPTT